MPNGQAAVLAQNLTFPVSGLLGDRKPLLLRATCNNAAMTVPKHGASSA
jgi:hypothetical protein